jgi:hypothetical protein
MMKFDSGSADTFGQVDLVVNKPGIPKVALLSPRLKHRLVACGAAALLAFAVGLLVAVFGARAADAPAQPGPTDERAGTHSVRGQPTAERFAPPNQPDVSSREASDIDKLYRELIGPPPATSSDSPSSTHLRTAPSNDAAGSVSRWMSPR